MMVLSQMVGIFLLVAMLFLHGCAAVQPVSEQSVEDMLGKVKLGVTTKAEIGNIFGKEHGTEKLRWIYTLSNTALGISEQKTGTGSGIFPFEVATTATNTQALITVHFTEGGTVSGLEVARFYNPPFANDYWYLIKEEPAKILELAKRAGETSDFRIVATPTSASGFALKDKLSKAQITVTLAQQILHVTSTNPYGRLANEYRVFNKRESEFIEKISAVIAGQEPAWAKASTNTSTPGRKNPILNATQLPNPSLRSNESTPVRSPELNAHSPAARGQVSNTARLSWKDNSNNETGFRIYRITGTQKIKIAELPCNATAHVDIDAPPKACYMVTAYNSAGESSPSNKACLPE